VYDLNLRFPDIIGKVKLTEHASKMIETSLDGITTDGHFWPQH
jgi:hypothetical protein